MFCCSRGTSWGRTATEDQTGERRFRGHVMDLHLTALLKKKEGFFLSKNHWTGETLKKKEKEKKTLFEQGISEA